MEPAEARLICGGGAAEDLRAALDESRHVTSGTVVCRVTPGARRLDWLARDLLGGLGKRGECSGTVRNEQERWLWATLWTRAEGVREIVVDRADSLTVAGWQRLVELAQQSGARLTLVTDSEKLSRGHKEAVVQLCLGEDSGEALVDRLAAEPQGPTASADYPRVPRSEFVLFRSRARDSLSRDEFAVVDRAYQHGRQRAAVWLSEQSAAQEEDEARWLAELVSDAQSTDEALTRIRGAQVAFFQANRLLSVETGRFCLTMDSAGPSLLDPAVVNRLRWYTDGSRSAGAALALATGLSAGRLAELDLADVPDDVSSVRTDGGRVPIPEIARPLVRVQLLRRQVAGAGPTDALLALSYSGAESRPTAHRLQLRLRAVSQEAGVRLTGHWTRQGSGDRMEWSRRHGLLVRSI